MADTKPRIGYQSILDNAEVVCSQANSSFPVANLADRGEATIFKPAWVGDSWIGALVQNGAMDDWSSGTLSAPDYWTLGGSSTVQQWSGAYHSAPYCTRHNSAAVGDKIYQALSNIQAIAGEYVTFKCWVYNTVASRSKINITDGLTSTSSSLHSGSGWEQLEVTHQVSASATKVWLEVELTVSGVNHYIDDATAYVSDALGVAAVNTGAPEQADIYIYPKHASCLLSNPYFCTWPTATSAPTGWTLAGASAAVLGDEDRSSVKIGRFASKLTRSGADASLSQSISSYSSYLNRVLSFGGWVKSDGTAEAVITLATDATSASTTASTSTDYTWVEGSLFIPYDATSITISVNTKDADGDCWFDGLVLLEGDTDDIAQTPPAVDVDYVGVAKHLLYSSKRAITLSHSTDNFATSTAVLSSQSLPSDDPFFKSFTSVSKSYFRLTLDGGDGSTSMGLGEIGILYLGEMYELPYYASPGLDPYQRRVKSETSRASGGRVLGRSILYEECKFSLDLPWVTLAEVKTHMAGFWAECGSGGSPFFLCWNEGTYANDTLFCVVPDNALASAPLKKGLLVERLSIPLEAIL